MGSARVVNIGDTVLVVLQALVDAYGNESPEKGLRGIVAEAVVQQIQTPVRLYDMMPLQPPRNSDDLGALFAHTRPRLLYTTPQEWIRWDDWPGPVDLDRPPTTPLVLWLRSVEQGLTFAATTGCGYSPHFLFLANEREQAEAAAADWKGDPVSPEQAGVGFIMGDILARAEVDDGE